MPIFNFNIPSQLVVQTAAQWAVDTTVYSEKRILITSNVFFGSTDQRKFKIADGVKTWSNLDYFPISGFDDATSSIQTQLNAKQASLGFTPEDVANKSTNIITDQASNTKYPSVKSVYDWGAPLASPALTGNPTAPTQTALDNSTKIATTAYVDSKTDHKSNTTAFSISSTGSDQIAHSYNLTGWLSVGKILSVGSIMSMNSAVNDKYTRYYLNSTNDLSGSPVKIAEFLQTTSGSTTRGLRRDFRIDSNTSLFAVVDPALSGGTNMWVTTPVLNTTTAITIPNITGNLYLLVVGQKSAGTLVIEMSHLMRI